MVRTRHVFVAVALAILSGVASIARPQCTSWSSVSGLPGLSTSAKCSAVWDPDGEGPLQPWLVLGGSFTIAGDTNVDSIVAWDGVSWKTVGTGMNADVNALCAYKGELIAGGLFTNAGGTVARRIARWNGVKWQPLGSGITSSGGVQSMAVIGDKLVVAGDFTIAGGVTVGCIAQWDGTSWSTLGSGAAASVRAIASMDNMLYAGGTFTTAGSVAALRVAKWDGVAWSAVGDGFDRQVNALQVHEGTLYAGGRFLKSGATACQYMAKLEGNSWRAVGEGIAKYGDSVDCLLSTGNGLYAGGYFHDIDHNYISRWDGTFWTRVGVEVHDQVLTLREFQGELYAGGAFTSLEDGYGVPGAGDYISKFNDTAWQPLVEGFNAPISCMGSFGKSLVVGGSFTRSPWGLSRQIAWYSDGQWLPMDGGITSNVDDATHAILEYKNRLYVGCVFERTGDAYSSGLLAWDGAQWQPFAVFKDFSTPGSVYALATYGGDLVIAGNFVSVDGVRFPNIARWDGASWRALGAGLPNWIVRSLAEYKGELYAGGTFSPLGSASSLRIAKWTGSDWQQVGDGGSGLLLDMESYKGELYVGGEFQTINTTSATRIARWNGSAWRPVGSGLSGTVHALEKYQDLLAVGGNFLGTSDFLTTWNGNAWLGTGGAARPVRSLGAFQGDLFVGGEFQKIGSIPTAYLAKWRRSTLPAFHDHPSDAVACPSEPFLLEASAASFPDPEYSWEVQIGGTWESVAEGTTGYPWGTLEASGASTSQLWVQVQEYDSVTPLPLHWRCRAATACGTALSNEATITLCPADIDCSGIVDEQDLVEFVSRFQSGGNDADVDGSGFVDTDDFDFYVRMLQAGC